ncbi:hypothetical protein [Methanocella sp. MCL-LM]|uniref:hypothetical protein n=1 Tax=Methanocella sp. MCL-LM TaxID=3412035 RepID=UPI003C7247E5
MKNRKSMPVTPGNLKTLKITEHTHDQLQIIKVMRKEKTLSDTIDSVCRDVAFDQQLSKDLRDFGMTLEGTSPKYAIHDAVVLLWEDRVIDDDLYVELEKLKVTIGCETMNDVYKFLLSEYQQKKE